MSLGPGIEFLYLSTRDPLPPAKVPLLAEGLQQAGPSAGPTQAMRNTTFVKFLKTQHGIEKPPRILQMGFVRWKQSQLCEERDGTGLGLPQRRPVGDS